MEQDATDNAPRLPATEHHANKVEGVRPDESPTRWWLWLADIASGAKQQDIAARIGVDQSHISRWKAGYRPGVDFVIKTAEAYGRNPLEALVAAEILTEAQAALHEVRITDYTQASDEELLEELLRRRKLGG